MKELRIHKLCTRELSTHKLVETEVDPGTNTVNGEIVP